MYTGKNGHSSIPGKYHILFKLRLEETETLVVTLVGFTVNIFEAQLLLNKGMSAQFPHHPTAILTHERHGPVF